MKVTDETAAVASVKNVYTSPERDKKGDDSLHDERELIAEAREWASSYASWGDNGLVDRLVDALEAKLTARDAEVAAKAWDEGWASAIHGFDLPDSEPGELDANPYRKAVQS